jgi:hypothetical protein
MPKTNPNKHAHDEQLGVSLKLESVDKKHPNVDAEEFLATAEKWLRALKSFATEQGEKVRWEIVALKKASAFIEVKPVAVKSRAPLPALVKSWHEGLEKIERTGLPAPKFSPESITALQAFVSSVPQDSKVFLGSGTARLQVTAVTQKRIEQAATHFPLQETGEYVSRGSIRGRLAVLDSWNPQDRSFRLQLPLSPNKPVECTYPENSVSSELGEGFDGMVEVTGLLKYKSSQPWPYAADVESIRVLPRKPKVTLQDLVGLVRLPVGQDSTSYVRGLRDADQ